MINKKQKTSNIATLVIDMQKFFLDYLDTKKRNELVNNHKLFLEYCHKKNIPTICIKYVSKERGDIIGDINSEILKKINKIPQSKIISKNKTNCFTNPEIEETLKEWDVNYICITGLFADSCLLDTVYGANGKYRFLTSEQLTKKFPYFNENKLFDTIESKGGLVFGKCKELIGHIDKCLSTNEKLQKLYK